MTPKRPTRLAPLDNPDPEVEEILAKGLTWNGAPLHMPATLARHPRLLKRFTVFAGAFLTHGMLPARDRELMTLRAAYRFDTDYYFGHHVLMASRAGLTAEEIAATCDPEHRWGGSDAVAIALADRLAESVDVDDTLWAELVSTYDEPQVLEAVMLVGFYRMLAGFVNAVGVEREDGVPGWPSAD